MPFVSTRNRVAVALHHARAECRAPDTQTAQHHRDVMCDVIEQADYPHLVLAEVARRLGRTRAMQVELPAKHINFACKTPKIFEGRL